MREADQYIGADIPPRPVSVEKVLTQRQGILTRLADTLAHVPPAEQQRILSAAITRACEAARERELDVLRHTQFGREVEAGRSRETVAKVQAERDLLYGLHYFLKFFQIDLRDVLRPVQREAEAHIGALEAALAARPVAR